MVTVALRSRGAPGKVVRVGAGACAERIGKAVVPHRTAPHRTNPIKRADHSESSVLLQRIQREMQKFIGV